MNGLYDLGAARATVDAARLRLKLTWDDESVLTLKAEHRHCYPQSSEITKRINDLRMPGQPESEAIDAGALPGSSS